MQLKEKEKKKLNAGKLYLVNIYYILYYLEYINLLNKFI